MSQNSPLPVFKSNYSLNSILTLKEAGKSEEGGPVSIVDICKGRGMKECFLVDNNMDGYITAFDNFRKAGIRLNFGLKIDVESGADNFHKIILFVKGAKHYEKLCSVAHTVFTKPKRKFITEGELRTHYEPDSFKIALPFYDSCLARNSLTLKQYVFDYERYDLVLLKEDNLHPFDHIITQAIDKFNHQNKYEVEKVKTICYNTRQDFKAFCTYLTIQKGTTLNKPQIDFLCSKEFCMEAIK